MIERAKEWLAIQIAYALPRRLVLWCAVRLAVHASSGPYSDEPVPDLKVIDALARWPGRRERPDL